MSDQRERDPCNTDEQSDGSFLVHLFFGTAKSVLSVLDEDSNIKMTVLKSRMTKMGPRKVVKNTAGPEMKQL